MNYQIIMIGGMPRSGTTLFSNYIQESLNIPVSPETHFFSCISKDNRTIDVKMLPKPVTDDPVLGPIYKGMNGNFVENPIVVFEKILEKVFKNNFKVVAEKTPRHLMSFDWIARSSHSYKFIIVHRSCVQVCNSLTQVPWNDGRVFKNSVRWLRYYVEELKLKKKYPSRVSIVDYSDFCKSPEKEVERIKLELDLTECDQCVSGFHNYNEYLEPWKANSKSSPFEIVKTSNLSISSRIYLSIFEKAAKPVVKFLVARLF